MKKYYLYTPLFFSFLSCGNFQNNNLCQKLYNFKSSDSCIIWQYDPKTEFIFSEKDEYYIWKKYGVIIKELYEDESTTMDSCYFAESKKYYINKIGHETLNKIDVEIDSITNNIDNYDDLYFHDSVFCNLYGITNSRNPELIDKEKYFFLKDSISSTLLIKNEKFIYFWIVIDSSGKLKNIEIINFNCSNIVKNKIFDVLNSLKWNPAVYKGNNVEFRYKDFIYIKGD